MNQKGLVYITIYTDELKSAGHIIAWEISGFRYTEQVPMISGIDPDGRLAQDTGTAAINKKKSRL